MSLFVNYYLKKHKDAHKDAYKKARCGLCQYGKAVTVTATKENPPFMRWIGCKDFSCCALYSCSFFNTSLMIGVNFIRAMCTAIFKVYAVVTRHIVA